MERRLHAVKRRYRKEVAPLKEEVLRLQMERLRQAAQRNMQSARHRNAYHDAQRAYETFQEERAVPEAVGTDELRRRYREASKQCHPDVVPDAYREEAAATFQALESAYEAGDIQSVRAIADALEQWGFPKDGNAPQNRDRGQLRRAISDLESAISSIEAREAYQAAVAANDMDALLRAWKERLVGRLRELRRQ